MNDFFRLDHDPVAGVAELVLDRPERMNTMRDHSTAASLEQMTLSQSAVFDIDERARAIAAWQAKTPASFETLGAIARP